MSDVQLSHFFSHLLPLPKVCCDLNIQHRQCKHCFLLTHNIDTCPHDPTTYKHCGICRKSGHLQADYNSGHCGHPHPSIPCNCPPHCFNCFFAKKPPTGHYTFSDKCPLKKNMRHYGSMPAPPTTNAGPRQLPTMSTLANPTIRNMGPKVPISAHQPAHPAKTDLTHVSVTNLAPSPPTL
jgi:hypothetical protein